MLRLPTISTRPYTLLPDTSLVRSACEIHAVAVENQHAEAVLLQRAGAIDQPGVGHVVIALESQEVVEMDVAGQRALDAAIANAHRGTGSEHEIGRAQV